MILRAFNEILLLTHKHFLLYNIKRFGKVGSLPPISLFICSDNNLKTQMRGDEVLVR